MGRPPKGAKPLILNDIITVALQQLDAQGEKAVTFRALAKYFNVTAMAITHHVGTREQLFAQMAAQVYQDIGGESFKKNPQDALKKSLEIYCQKVIRHPQLTQYIFTNPTLIADQLDVLTIQITQYLAQTVIDKTQVKTLLGVIVDYTHGFAISASAYSQQNGQKIEDYRHGLNWILSQLPKSQNIDSNSKKLKIKKSLLS